MRHGEFVGLVDKMRAAQRQYFAALRGSTEQKRWLMESKRLEHMVDDEIVREKQNQLDLFGSGEETK